jgi:hypothetical protein
MVYCLAVVQCSHVCTCLRSCASTAASLSQTLRTHAGFFFFLLYTLCCILGITYACTHTGGTRNLNDDDYYYRRGYYRGGWDWDAPAPPKSGANTGATAPNTQPAGAQGGTQGNIMC